jgi:multiple sugar transport system substrate-binding protein
MDRAWTRRRMVTLLCTGAASALVAACGGTSGAATPTSAPAAAGGAPKPSTPAASAAAQPTPAKAAGKVALTYWSQLQPETQRWKDNQVVIDSFLQANPDVAIQVEHPAFADLDTKLVTAARAGTPPDMSEVSDSFPQLAKGGFLVQLDSFVAQTKLDLKDYFEGKLGTCYVDGKLFALPITADCRAMYWNMKLFKDAGIDQPPKDWDGLVAAAQKVTKGGVYGWGVHGGNSGFAICEQFSAFFIQNDAKIMSDDLKTCVADSPAWIQGATFWQNLIAKYKVTQPSMTTDGQNEVDTLFSQGKLGMYPGGPWARANIARINPAMKFGEDFSASVVPYPKDKHPGTCQGGWLQVLWSASKVQDAATKLLAFYHTTENIAQEARSSMPTRQSSTKIAPFNDPWYNPFWETMPYARQPVPTMPAGGEITTALFKMLQTLILNQKTDEQGAKDFAKEVNQQILPRYT